MKVRAASNNPTLFLDIENILLKPVAQGPKEKLPNDIFATVKDVKLVKNFLQLQLNEYDSRTSVENFRGAHIYTSKSELRDLGENEWWVEDLIGLEVYTTEGKLIGTVCDAPGEHGEFLEIKKIDVSKGETAIISFVKELFPVVNIKAKRIEVIDLPGLFE
jgi:16S rRNA processing protein RimM